MTVILDYGAGNLMSVKNALHYLGLQALFEKSEESPGVQGLGIFEGNVTRYKQGKGPHTGWNKVIPVQYHPEKSGPFGLEFLRRWLTC